MEDKTRQASRSQGQNQELQKQVRELKRQKEELEDQGSQWQRVAEGEKTRINREINADKLKITQFQYDIEN